MTARKPLGLALIVSISGVAVWAARRYVKSTTRFSVSEVIVTGNKRRSSDDVALVLTPESAWTWDERRNPATDALRSSGGALPLEPTAPRVA